MVETTQAATENVLKNYNRVKKSKEDGEKKMTKRNEHSFTGVPSKMEKLQRDVFGATILPPNLSFDVMKKLSMNEIKLEDVPLVDENKAAELLLAEKMSKEKRKDVAEEKAEESKVYVPEPEKKVALDFAKADPFEEIPGPRTFESMMTTMKFGARHVTIFFLLHLLRIGSFDTFKKYGFMVRLPEILGGRILLINRAEDVRAVYEQDQRHPESSCLDIIECSRLRRHGSSKKSGVVSEVEWKETRKAIDDVLQRDEEKYFDGLEDSAGQLVRAIRCLKNKENEVPEDFKLEINKWSLDCLFQILFYKSFGFLDQENMKWPSKNARLLFALQDATRSFHDCEGGFQMWRFMKTDAATSLDIACHAAEEILSRYVYQSQLNLLRKDEDLNTEPLTLTEGLLLLDGMTKRDVVTNLLDILLIGMNTTSNALAFLLYHLANNPRAQSELFKEVKEILPEKYSLLEYEQVNSLRYLRACLKESLRLKLPMPILMKLLKSDVVLSNYQVPRGTFVIMAVQDESLREENFDYAHEFRPSRWLSSDNQSLSSHIPLNTSTDSSFETHLIEASILSCVARIVRNFFVEYRYGPLMSAPSTLSCPTTPLKFNFFEREA